MFSFSLLVYKLSFFPILYKTNTHAHIHYHADTSLNPQTDRLTLARDAVETNNAGLLQSCILSFDRDTLTNNVGTSLLELASECGHSSCVKVLLDFGCDPNGRGSMTTRATPTTSTTTPPTNKGVHGDGLSPLHLAANNGHQK